MNNQTLGTLLIISVSIAVLTGIFSGNIDSGTQDVLYMIAGLGMIVFGYWAGFRLRKM